MSSNKCLIGLFIGLGLIFTSLSYATKTPWWQHKSVQNFIQEMVAKHNLNKASLNKLFKKVAMKPKVIALIKRPYEAKPWYLYRKHFITNQRIEAGRAFAKIHSKTLTTVSKRYGVPASIIVAIIGVESSYGAHKGQFRVIDALSTLAFHYPKRAKFFRKELTQFLLLTKEQHIDPLNVYGSYAGAIGWPQFMPSSYRHYAVDYQADGRADLRADPDDVIASVANYLHKNGWQAGKPIAVPAAVEGKDYKSLLTKSRKPKYRIAQFTQKGVTPTQTLPTNTRAKLIALRNNKDGRDYWLGCHNFYVITRYNTSTLYAMAVFQLANAIA